MKNRWLYVLVSLAFLLVFSLYLSAQVREPGIPRAWWPSVKGYIDGKASAQAMTFSFAGVPSDRVLAVFSPVRDISVDRIDVYAHAPVDSDSTALEIANGLAALACILDSAGGAQRWSADSPARFAASLPCTVRFSDAAFLGEFVSGADSPSVVIQYHVAP